MYSVYKARIDVRTTIHTCSSAHVQRMIYFLARRFRTHSGVLWLELKGRESGQLKLDVCKLSPGTAAIVGTARRLQVF
jgi:hypothetical protein